MPRRQRTRGHRADAHPLGALPRGGPGPDPRRRPGRPARERLARGPLGQPARRRRGPAPRSHAGGQLRPPPGTLPAARLGALGDGRRGAAPDAGGRRAPPRHHQRPRRLQRAHRRVHADDDPGRRAPAARAPRAAARAHLAAAAGARAAPGHHRHRRASAPSAGPWRAWPSPSVRASSPRAATPTADDAGEPIPEGLDGILLARPAAGAAGRARTSWCSRCRSRPRRTSSWTPTAGAR